MSRKDRRGGGGEAQERVQGWGGGAGRLELAAAVGATLLAVFLHVLRLRHAGPLWRDEINSVVLSCLPLTEAWELIARDSFPALFPAILRLLQAAGLTSESALRCFGTLMGLGLAAAFWAGARLMGSGPPLLCLALAAASPVVVAWGDSLRAYGLGSALIVLSFAAFWRAIEEPERRRGLWAVGLCVLSVQCLYQNLVLVLGLCVAGLLSARRLGLRERVWVPAAAGGGAALSLLPYAGRILDAREAWEVLRLPVTLPLLWSKLSQALGAPWPWLAWVWAAAWAAALGAGWLGSAEEGRERRLFCAASLAAGACLYAVFLMSAGLVTESWYYLPLMAFSAFGMDAIFGGPGPARGALAAAVALLVLAAALPSARAVRQRQTNLDLAAAQVTGLAGSADLVVVNPWYLGVGFGRYYTGKASWTTAPRLEDTRIHRADLLKAKLAEGDPLAATLERMESTLASGGRVWVVGGLFLTQNPPTVMPPAPRGPQGWYSGPYLDSWSQRLGHFAMKEGVRAELLPPPFEGPVNPYEDVRVVMISR